MKAVAYARFSSDNQREESITAQLRAIHDYAAKHGVTIAREYIDEARSATTDDRPEFLHMIDDLTSGILQVDYVYVHKLDRFARNRYDAAFYRRSIQKNGARLIAVDQPLDDSPESIILEGVLEAMAEYYSKNLAREVMKGLKENAIKGLHTGGTPPLGYDVGPDKKLVINEKEAAAVRLIFNRVLEGQGYSSILEELNKKGFKTKKGNSFGKNSLYDILRNRKYTGDYVYNRSAKKTDGVRNNHKSKDEEQIIRIEGAIPAIISKEVFEKVQEILDNRKQQTSPRAKSKIEYILTGKLFCEVCGSAMVGNSGRSKNGKRYNYYECNRAMRTKECSNKPISKDALERLVLDQIERQIFSPSKHEELAEKLLAYANEKFNYIKAEKENVNKCLATCQGKIDRIINLLIEVGKREDLVRQLDMLEEERNRLRREAERLNEERPSLTKETVLAYLKQASQALNENSPATCRALVQKFVHRIVVGPETLNIDLNVNLHDEGVLIKMVEIRGVEPLTS